MIIDVIMPKMGESITEGTVLEWYKKVGESIEKDETLLEIGTDKVDSEIPSPASGVIEEILAEPNDVIDVGEVIARINSDGSSDKKDRTSSNDIDQGINNKVVYITNWLIWVYLSYILGAVFKKWFFFDVSLA